MGFPFQSIEIRKCLEILSPYYTLSKIDPENPRPHKIHKKLMELDKKNCPKQNMDSITIYMLFFGSRAQEKKAPRPQSSQIDRESHREDLVSNCMEQRKKSEGR